MIPILYESTETAFASNGLGRLRDCISCTVTEERNGIYECDFEYPVTGTGYENIKLGRIIAVEHDDSNDVQPFDIVSCTRPINGVVTFHAQHISYRQSGLTVSGTDINSLAAAFTALGSSVPTNPFSYETDITSSAYCSAFDGVPRSVRSILGGIEGSILDAYGGEYEWDKWTVKLWQARGEPKNFTIRYGVNLLDYTEDLDYSESYSSVVPFWKSSDGTVVIGSQVSSGYTALDRDICIPMDLSEKFESQPTTSDLEDMASSILSANSPYAPSQTITVDFVRLQDADEYSQFEDLLECKLCDTIRIVFPLYDMSGTFKIVKTVYNVLLEKYDSMELGTLSTSLAEALGISSASSSASNTGILSATVSTYTDATTISTWKSGPSLSLTAGTWLIIGTWDHATLSSTTARQYAARLYDVTNSTTLRSVYTTGGTSYTATSQVSYLMTVSSATTVRLDGASNKANTTAKDQLIQAVKIA